MFTSQIPIARQGPGTDKVSIEECSRQSRRVYSPPLKEVINVPTEIYQWRQGKPVGG